MTARENFLIPVEIAGKKLALAACRVRNNDQPPSGAPIILLHEGLGSIAQWKDFPEKLSAATGREILLYDRQGYGLSPKLTEARRPDYLHRYAMIELRQVICTLELDKPVLFGHSDGGSIALIYAAHYPVAAALTAAAHVFVEDICISGIKEAVTAWQETDLPGKLARYHGDKTEQIFFAWADTWLSREFRDWNIEPLLAKITAPLLALQGAEDEYGTDAQVHAITRQVSGPARPLIIPNCRHIPHLQASEPVLKEASAFLAKI
ncbi:alpha/beta fold hydrolase [Aestuariispira insulae]|uniref:Pimeloyl-ACP methyl ester carboxylesterase n=1 Tax=Aestuariispira insulae TaxID=1461337 RepID=A0A3D9HPU6_9PROT|nr:alpha/beta hydrolase [Aestuariispira insulae]RED51534.1 pimeloyl-ACP methyl ester carboxylesterase [Aestuariispira insulae]